VKIIGPTFDNHKIQNIHSHLEYKMYFVKHYVIQMLDGSNELAYCL